MKTAPVWIHTGLNIHPRLARFLKKWGFTREPEPARDAETMAYFQAIVNGVAFNLHFFMHDGQCRIHNFNRDIVSRYEKGIPALEKFMRDNSKPKG